MGDAIIIIFGLFDDREGGEINALKCGCSILDKTASLSLPYLKKGKRLEVSITLNSGNMVSSRLGDSDRMQYYILGKAINELSEYEDSALPNRIVVGERIYEKLNHLYSFKIHPENKNLYILK